MTKAEKFNKIQKTNKEGKKMKFYDIHETDTYGRDGRCVKYATAEEFEEFKKGKEWAKFYICEDIAVYENPVDPANYDYYVYAYEARLVYAVEELKTFTHGLGYGARDENSWTEIATYKTKRGAEKRIGKEYEKYRDWFRVVERYQRIDEVREELWEARRKLKK